MWLGHLNAQPEREQTHNVAPQAISISASDKVSKSLEKKTQQLNKSRCTFSSAQNILVHAGRNSTPIEKHSRIWQLHDQKTSICLKNSQNRKAPNRLSRGRLRMILEKNYKNLTTSQMPNMEKNHSVQLVDTTRCVNTDASGSVVEPDKEHIFFATVTGKHPVLGRNCIRDGSSTQKWQLTSPQKDKSTPP